METDYWGAVRSYLDLPEMKRTSLSDGEKRRYIRAFMEVTVDICEEMDHGR